MNQQKWRRNRNDWSQHESNIWSTNLR